MSYFLCLQYIPVELSTQKMLITHAWHTSQTKHLHNRLLSLSRYGDRLEFCSYATQHKALHQTVNPPLLLTPFTCMINLVRQTLLLGKLWLGLITKPRPVHYTDTCKCCEQQMSQTTTKHVNTVTKMTMQH